MAWIYKVTNQAGQMTLAEQQNNATEIRNQLMTSGWTLNAICGLLGNVTRESYINPAQTQIGYPIDSSKGGYGLVQWTPASKYKNWATENSHDITDGYWQVFNIDTQASGVQYIKTAMYPLSYDEFKTSLETPAYLTEVFLKNYERAGVEALESRVEWAEYWYSYFNGEQPDPPTPPPDPKKKAKGMPVWMMIRHA